MDDVSQSITRLQSKIASAIESLDIAAVAIRVADLEEQMAEPDFWQNPDQAQKISKQHAGFSKRCTVWRELEGNIAVLGELAATNDSSLVSEITQQYDQLAAQYDELEVQITLSGPYDDKPALLRFQAGTGGTDAQDWTEMLLRMYVRYGEMQDFNTELISESRGEEAGIKTATLRITGLYAYGLLKGEHGVHRLVRMSPFNSDNLRQTSFARLEVLPEIDEPGDVDIPETDLRIDVYRAGGNGGQSVNTTDSAVRITHLPTGITVAIQNERSQIQNKDTAMTILRSKLIQLQQEQRAQAVSDLKGEVAQEQWGQQIRNYVLHPYTQVKDTRTGHTEKDAQKVLDGKLDDFLDAYLRHNIAQA